MGTQAPAVVALVVASRAGPWLDETLESLAGQDYPNLSVLVVGPDPHLAARVAACLPDAHFALVDGGFAEGANAGMEMVGTAAHVVLCHGDVSLAPSAIRLLVEEAYRSNVGLTCPKLVTWESPERLLSVGMGADHLGVVHPLVELGELDQGQHDGAREVFVAPGGAVLVRSDLWHALGGLCIGAAGDLDLSWRAQLAGARVVVAPQAVVRHRAGCDQACSQSPGQEAQRLRTLWACYSARSLLFVAPMVLILALLEAAWRLASKHVQPGAPLVSLGRSLQAPAELRRARRRVKDVRRVSDFSIWKSQTGGARLGAAVRAQAPHLRWRWPAVGVVVLAVLLLAGSRDILSGPIPFVGQLPRAAGGVSSWWHAWWSGPGTPGFGGTSFGAPGLLFMGVFGIVCFGSAGVAAHLLVVGPLLLGPLGAYLAARRFGSERGQLAAGVVYAALPLPYDAISQGHFGGLVGYAAAPWLLDGLSSEVGWKRLTRLALVLGLAAAVAPTLLLVVPLMGAALAAGSLLTGERDEKPLLAGVGLAAGAFVLLLPWSSQMALGAPGGQRIGFGHLLGMQTGPYGGGLTWALLAAAGVSLFIGRGRRFASAVRMWVVALVFFALAWAWSPAGGLELLLAPAGAALASCIALGAASVEGDLSKYRFGWHQVAPALGVAAAVATTLPLLSWVTGGRWDLPSAGADAAYTFPAPPAGELYRVLWLGPPGSLPVATQGTMPGQGMPALAFAASTDGAPSAGQLWAAPPSRLAAAVGKDLAWAQTGETTMLGHLLAMEGVRYLVAPLAPEDASLLSSLGRQVDLTQVGIDPSYAVYSNSAWLPVFFALRPGPVARQLTAVAAADSQRDAAVRAQRLQGSYLRLDQARAGDVVYGAVPPGTWGLHAGGATVTSVSGALGATLWRSQGAEQGAATVSSTGGVGENLGAVATLVLWAAGVGMAFRRRKSQQAPVPAKVDPVEAKELVLVGAGDTT